MWAMGYTGERNTSLEVWHQMPIRLRRSGATIACEPTPGVLSLGPDSGA